jgi:hypothetical protein
MSRRLTITVLLLLAVSLVNIALLRSAPGGIKPVRLHESADLRHLIQVEQMSLGPAYEVYLALREHAAGLELVAPPGVLTRTHVDGLADMVLTVASSSVSLDEEQAAPLVAEAVDSGDLQIPGEPSPRAFHVVEPAPGTTSMVLAFTPTGVVVVDEDTLAAVTGGG